MVRFLINKTINMEFEEIIKQKLSIRGFTQKQILNNRGLISAVIDETILLQTKNLTIPVVSRSKPIKIKSIFDVIPYYIDMWNKNKRKKKQKELDDYIQNIIDITETKN